MLTRSKGAAAEQQACNYLLAQGLKLIKRNYHCRLGEIDLIMQERQSLIFVEVRYRSYADFGGGAESITWHKQTKLINTANYYLQQQGLLHATACRFDVIAITQHIHGTTLEWIKNAFETN